MPGHERLGVEIWQPRLGLGQHPMHARHIGLDLRVAEVSRHLMRRPISMARGGPKPVLRPAVQPLAQLTHLGCVSFEQSLAVGPEFFHFPS